MWETGETWVVGEKNIDMRVSFGRSYFDRGYLENSIRKEAEREVQGARGLKKNRRENMFPSLRLIGGFGKKYH